MREEVARSALFSAKSGFDRRPPARPASPRRAFPPVLSIVARPPHASLRRDTPERKDPGTAALNDGSRSVKDGGSCFWAYFGVDHDRRSGRAPFSPPSPQTARPSRPRRRAFRPARCLSGSSVGPASEGRPLPAAGSLAGPLGSSPGPCARPISALITPPAPARPGGRAPRSSAPRSRRHARPTPSRLVAGVRPISALTIPRPTAPVRLSLRTFPHRPAPMAASLPSIAASIRARSTTS